LVVKGTSEIEEEEEIERMPTTAERERMTTAPSTLQPSRNLYSRYSPETSEEHYIYI
jgi:hypothetical protein